MKKRIVLFDIDGTLIHTSGCGLAAMNRAFYDVFGWQNALEGVALAGCTDASISIGVFEQFGLRWRDEHLDSVKCLYYQYLEEELNRHEREKTLLPGFPLLLDALQQFPGIHIGLLTGNWQQGAKIKLEYFGIWEYFKFGAFGDDHHDRNALLPFALDRMQARYGHVIHPQSVFIVGDTPRDVQCGRPYDAVTIAVATGPYCTERLRAENPHYVLSDLANVSGFVDLIDNH